MRRFTVMTVLVNIVLISVATYYAVRAGTRPAPTPKTGLDVVVLTNTPLLTLGTAGPGSGIEVSFNATPLHDPWQVVLRVWNSGQTSVRSRDVAQPLRLDLSAGALALAAKVVATYPPGVSFTVEPTGDGVVMSCPLLNPGDSVDVTVLYETGRDVPSSKPVAMTASARIEGIKLIRFRDLSTSPVPRRKVSPLWIALLVALMSAIYTALVKLATEGISILRGRKRRKALEESMAATSTTLHVMPRGEQWAVRDENDMNDLAVLGSAQAAIDRATEYSKLHRPCHLVVHNADGSIAREETYA
jgi:hypothetical protein